MLQEKKWKNISANKSYRLVLKEHLQYGPMFDAQLF